jgi:hypothetical protein
LEGHVKEKSLQRCDYVFKYFSDPKVMGSSLEGDSKGPVKTQMGALCSSLRVIIQNNKLVEI